MIRQFRTGDAQDCCNLLCDCIRQDPAIRRETREELLRRESPAAMLERARRFFIAVRELEARIAGLGGVEMNEIRLLQVLPELQGHGVGRSLLKHLEATVPAALFPDIFVYSSPAAESFYRAHAYMPKGKHVFRIGNQRLDTIFMVKKLEPNRNQAGGC